MSTVQSTTRRRFPRMASTAFEHPLDKAALEAVRKIPFIDKVIRKLIEFGFERRMRVMLLGQTVQVGPKQCARIHALLKEACDILDMHEPDLFLMNHFAVNAWTFGVERPFIVLHSELVDLLTEEELLGVIGHELGHVKANHVLYRTIVYFLLQIIESLAGGFGRLGSLGLMAALFDWARKSELTADRAELLVVQDASICVSTHMKLASGSKKIYAELDNEEFLRQGAKYEDLDYDMLNKFYKFFFELWLSHPLPVYRAKEIKDWSEGKQYQEIMEGRYPTKDDGDLGLRDCPHCGCKVSPTFFFCPDCGKNARM